MIIEIRLERADFFFALSRYFILAHSHSRTSLSEICKYEEKNVSLQILNSVIIAPDYVQNICNT